MPLSEHEQRVLDELERSLARDDRRLAQVFRQPNQRSFGRSVLVAGGVIAGMLVLILGAMQSTIWLGVLGFFMMFMTLAWGISGRRATAPVEPFMANTDQSIKAFNESSFSTNGAGKSGFMDRLGDRWDRRQSDSR
jgi:hypothetical protein